MMPVCTPDDGQPDLRKERDHMRQATIVELPNEPGFVIRKSRPKAANSQMKDQLVRSYFLAFRFNLERLVASLTKLRQTCELLSPLPCNILNPFNAQAVPASPKIQ
jgi:hypothetical protein